MKNAVNILSISLMVASAHAAVTWDNGAGDNSWHSGLNWNGDVVPTSQDAVSIGATASPANYTTAANDGANYITDLDMNGAGTLNISADMQVGNYTNPVSSTSPIYIVNGATINQTAGTLKAHSANTSSSLKIANNSSYNLSGGTLNMYGGLAAYAFVGSSAINYTGGTMVSTGGSTTIGTLGSGAASFTFNGSGLGYAISGANGDFDVGASGTLKVVGDSSLDTLSITGVNGSLDMLSGSIYEVVLNALDDKFLSTTTASGINLTGSELKVDNTAGLTAGTYDILSGTFNSDFSSFDLGTGVSVVDNGSVDGTYTIQVVPEPATIGMLGLSGLAIIIVRRLRL